MPHLLHRRRSADSVVEPSIAADVSGDVSGQVAVGNHNVQVNAAAGAVVNVQAPGAAPVPRRRARPALGLGGRDFPGLLGREGELGEARAALENGEPVELFGEPGIGKTSLLRRLAHSATREPAVVIFATALGLPRRDLLQLIFEAFYETDVPYQPDDTTLRTLLWDCSALVVLDDADLVRPDVQALLGDVPSCTFAFASEFSVALGEGRSLPLRGLGEDDAVALLERELGQPVDRNAAVRLVRALQGHPLRIVQAATLARAGGIELEELASPDEVKARARDALSPVQREILELLESLDQAPLGTEHVAALVDDPSAAADLADMEQRGLVQSHSPSYSVAEPASALLGRPSGTALAYFGDWAESGASRERIVAEAPALLATIEHGLAEGEDAGVLRLGMAIERAFAGRLHWDAWETILARSLAAARRLEDRAAEAYLLHQLGSRALCLGEPAAAALLGEALQLREALGDHAGAAATQHNLDVLHGGPPPAHGGGGSGGGGPHVPWIPVIATVVVAAAVAVGVVAATRPSHHNASSTVPVSQPGAPATQGGGGQARGGGGGKTTGGGGGAAPLVALTADVKSVEFPDTQVGSTSADKTVTVTNPNSVPVLLAFSTPDSSTIEPHAGTCQGGADLAARGSCTITLQFTPDQAGLSKGTLEVKENETRPASPLDVALSGNGVAPRLSFDPPALTFDQTLVGDQAAPRTVTATNTGIGPVTLGTASADGDFSVVKDGCSSRTLDPGSGCSIAVGFKPSAEGTSSGTLSVPLQTPQVTFPVTLSGSGFQLK